MGSIIKTSSTLNIAAEKLWEEVTLMNNVNYELLPFVKMTYPKSTPLFSLARVERGRVIFKSTLLLLGFIPYDRHNMLIKEIGPGFRFVEDSTSLIMKYWRHTREVTPLQREVSHITDCISFTSRIKIDFLIRPIIQAIFKHRHHRLQKRYGAC